MSGEKSEPGPGETTQGKRAILRRAVWEISFEQSPQTSFWDGRR